MFGLLLAAGSMKMLPSMEYSSRRSVLIEKMRRVRRDSLDSIPRSVWSKQNVRKGFVVSRPKTIRDRDAAARGGSLMGRALQHGAGYARCSVRYRPVCRDFSAACGDALRKCTSTDGR